MLNYYFILTAEVSNNRGKMFLPKSDDNT